MVESNAPGIAERQPVKEPMQTGIKAVDAMTPIGRGQRELIIGDRKTGKTAIGIDAIINQKGSGVKCFYVAVGQKNRRFAGVSTHSRSTARWTTRRSSSPAPALRLRSSTSLRTPAPRWPSTSMYNGQHALIVYERLVEASRGLPPLSLLMRRPPGREAYPGDVFYAHSRLLERSAKLSKELGGGSLTTCPSLKRSKAKCRRTFRTNVISITDGQIYLQPTCSSPVNVRL